MIEYFPFTTLLGVAMRVFLNVTSEGIETRAVGWISLQPDGAISVGLRDRTFISLTFRTRNFVWNLYNRVTLEYLVPHSPDTLEPVPNPHLTFHPPGYFHLRANGEDELFAGIAEPRLMLHADETVPWLRFVSKPVNELSRASEPRSPEKTMVETITIPDANCSVGLGIDFVRSEHGENRNLSWSNYFNCGEHRIHAFAEPLLPQFPTLSWFHQC